MTGRSTGPYAMTAKLGPEMLNPIIIKKQSVPRNQ